MMALGGILLNLSTVVFLGESTVLSCLGRVWLFNLSFDFVFAILWARIYRVYVLFTSTKKLRRVVIKDTDMVRVALALTMVDAIILLVWSVVDPPTPTVTRNVYIELPAQGLGDITYTECSSQSDAYGTATLVFKVILVLSACVLVFSAKNIPASYVEHKYIVFSAYNTAIFSASVLLVGLSVEPSTAMIAHAAGVSIGSTIVVGALTLPRVAIAKGLMTPPETSATSTWKSSGGGPAGTASSEEESSTYASTSEVGVRKTSTADLGQIESSAASYHESYY
jgi:hypothetical protein